MSSSIASSDSQAYDADEQKYRAQTPSEGQQREAGALPNCTAQVRD